MSPVQKRKKRKNVPWVWVNGIVGCPVVEEEPAEEQRRRERERERASLVAPVTNLGLHRRADNLLAPKIIPIYFFFFSIWTTGPVKNSPSSSSLACPVLLVSSFCRVRCPSLAPRKSEEKFLSTSTPTAFLQPKSARRTPPTQFTAAQQPLSLSHIFHPTATSPNRRQEDEIGI